MVLASCFVRTLVLHQNHSIHRAHTFDSMEQMYHSSGEWLEGKVSHQCGREEGKSTVSQYHRYLRHLFSSMTTKAYLLCPPLIASLFTRHSYLSRRTSADISKPQMLCQILQKSGSRKQLLRGTSYKDFFHDRHPLCVPMSEILILREPCRSS